MSPIRMPPYFRCEKEKHVDYLAVGAQRDYFGAHTYEPIDRPRGAFFHTNWTGRGGEVAAGSYNV
jgi:6-phosphogluconate dehydrogenase